MEKKRGKMLEMKRGEESQREQVLPIYQILFIQP